MASVLRSTGCSGQMFSALRSRKAVPRHELAEKLGITDRKLQEYEAGVSRISASKLCEIAKALEAEIQKCSLASTCFALALRLAMPGSPNCARRSTRRPRNKPVAGRPANDK